MATTGTVTDFFRMPALGADMTEGRVIEWLVEEGQAVGAGELVAVVETDKADIEIEVFEPCVFDEFLVGVDEHVPVGEPIARISAVVDGTVTSSTKSRTTEPVRPAEPTPSAAGREPASEPPPRSATTRRLTPRARRLAAELGVDVADLTGDGAVTGDAVIGLAEGRALDEPDRSERMRRAIASLMEQSWREIPHYHVGQRLDVTDLEARLADHNAERSVTDRVVLAAVLNLAVARAAAATPQINGWWRDGRFVPADDVDLGLIVSLRGGGIVAPTILDAAALDLDQMMAAIGDLVGRARRGRLRERDLQPASISITNMGERGADSVAGVIYPPQVALIGLGAPRIGAGVVGGVLGGGLAPRTFVQATVAGDHRAHDGLVAARLLGHVTEQLENLP